MKDKINGKIVLTSGSNIGLCYLIETNRKTALRVFQLSEAIMRDPFQGISKPEPLKFLGSDVWSRRISQRKTGLGSSVS